VEHRVTHDGALAVEGFETRVWVSRDPGDPARIKSLVIPPRVIARLTDASLVPSR
jgi:4-hydroxybenzoyl-CoA thioesterase